MASARARFASRTRRKATAAKGYYLRSFEDAFARYLPTSGVSKRPSVTNPGKQGESEDFANVTNQVCDGLENAGNASKSGVCDAWTLQKGGVRANARNRDAAMSEINTSPDVIIASARGGGVVFVLAEDRALFTEDWRGPYDPLIAGAIKDNYEAILA